MNINLCLETEALDMGKYVVGVFLDLKKAFDTIDQGILLRKLKSYGIQRNILNWFKSYLSDRSQYAQYNSSKSEKNTYITVYHRDQFWVLYYVYGILLFFTIVGWQTLSDYKAEWFPNWFDWQFR